MYRDELSETRVIVYRYQACKRIVDFLQIHDNDNKKLICLETMYITIQRKQELQLFTWLHINVWLSDLNKCQACHNVPTKQRHINTIALLLRGWLSFREISYYTLFDCRPREEMGLAQKTLDWAKQNCRPQKGADSTHKNVEFGQKYLQIRGTVYKNSNTKNYIIQRCIVVVGHLMLLCEV
jgi:hypothetical protein